MQNFGENEDMALANVKVRKQERSPNAKKRRRAKEAPEIERGEAKGLTEPHGGQRSPNK